MPATSSASGAAAPRRTEHRDWPGVPTSSTRSALIWSFSERYANLLLSVGGIVILSRLLTPAQVGVYSLCAAVTVIAGILRDFGVSEYLIQEKDLTRDRIRTAFGIAMAIAWAVGLCIFLSRDAMATYYREPGVSEVLAVLSLNFLLLPFSSPAYALLSREMAFRKLFILQFASNLAANVTGVVLAYLDYGFYALAWMPVANIATQTLLMQWLRPQASRVWPALIEVRRVLGFGWMFVTTRFVEVFSRNAHEPVVAKQLGFESVGLFSRAYGLIDMVNLNVISAVVQVATPKFAADNRAGQPVGESFVSATILLTGVCWPIFCYLALMDREIILLMFGAQWMAAAPLASVLALTGIVGSWFALAPQLLSATGHVKERMTLNLWAAGIHVVGVFVAVPIGLRALACVWFASSSFKLAIYLYHLRRIYGLSPWSFLARSAASGAVALATSGGVLVVANVARAASLPTVIVLALAAVGGAAAWWLAARALRHPAAEEVRRIVAAVRRKRVPDRHETAG